MPFKMREGFVRRDGKKAYILESSTNGLRSIVVQNNWINDYVHTHLIHMRTDLLNLYTYLDLFNIKCAQRNWIDIGND